MSNIFFSGAGGGGFVIFTESGGGQGIYADAAARDVYFDANQSEVNRVAENENLIIKLLDNGSAEIAYQQYLGVSGVPNESADWNDVTSLVQGETGPAGATGNSFFFESLTARDDFFSDSPNEQLLMNGLPVVVNEGTVATNFFWSGEDAPVSYDADLFRPASVGSSPGSLFLGEGGMAMSSAARTINLVDAYGDTAVPIGTVYNEFGNIAPWQWDFAASIDTAIADVFDTVLADPQLMVFDTAGSDTITRSYSVRPATAGDLRIRAFAGTLITDPVILDTTITILVGDVGNIVQIVLDNNLLIQSGDDLLVEFSGIQLDGGLQTSGIFDTQTVPFLNVNFALLTRRDLVIQGDQAINIQSPDASGTAELVFDGSLDGDLADIVFDETDSSLSINVDIGALRFNTNIEIDNGGQILTITSEDASGTPSIQFNDSSTALGGSIVFDETDDDLTITAALGDLQLLSTSSDIEIIAGSQFVGINFSDPVSKLHIFEDSAATGTAAGLTVEQDGAGDALMHFRLTGVTDWTMGVDNSLADQFAIRPDLALNATAPLQILTTGEIGINKTPRANHCLDIDTALNTVVALYDTKDVTLEQGNNDNTNSTDLFFNRADVGFNQSEFHIFNGNNNVELQRLFHMNFTDAGTSGGLAVFNTTGFVSVGIGENEGGGADTLLHLRSEGADTVAVQTWETTGTNGAIIKNFVGTQDPVGNVTGSPGDKYTRVSGVNSEEFIHQGASADNTSWRELSIGENGNVTTSDTLSSNVLLRGNGGVDIDAISGVGLAQVRTNSAGDAIQIITDEAGSASFELLDDNQNDRVILEYDIDANTGNLTTSVQFTVDVTGDLNLISSAQVSISADVLALDSPNDDTDSILTLETEGANAGIVHTFVGDRDPNGLVTGAGGDEYRRDDGATSGSYESLEATTGTEWFKRSVNDPNVVEIHNLAEFDALASGGIITISEDTCLKVLANFTTLSVIDVTAGDLIITGDYSQTATIDYGGTGTFLTVAAGSDLRTRARLRLASSSTGTLVDFTGASDFNLCDFSDCTITGWDDHGTINGGTLALNKMAFTFWGGPFRIIDANLIGVDVIAAAGGSLFQLESESASPTEGVAVNLNNFDGAFLFGPPFKIDPDIGDPSLLLFSNMTTGSANTPLFDTSGTTGAFTAVVDNSIALTTITSVTDNAGSAVFNHAGTTPIVGSTIVISAFVTETDYNGTFRVSASTATTFECTGVDFTADDTGSYAVTSITVTATAHGLSNAQTLQLDTTGATDYDGGFRIYNVQTNTFDVAAVFGVTRAGTWDTSGLDQTNPQVLAFQTIENQPSHYIATAFVNNNATVNGAIVNNTFTDMVFGTGGSALVAASTMERWKLIDEIDGTFEYTGAEPFDGSITFDFTVTSSGGTTDFRFKWVRDSNAVVTNSFIDFADANPDEIFNQLGDFLTAGFNPDDEISVSGSASNDGTYTIATVTAQVITLIGTDTLVNEANGPTITITALESDLADNVEALVAVGSDAQSITKTFPLKATTGDQIKPQITRNSGASTITTMYATIYATQ